MERWKTRSLMRTWYGPVDEKKSEEIPMLWTSERAMLKLTPANHFDYLPDGVEGHDHEAPTNERIG